MFVFQFGNAMCYQSSKHLVLSEEKERKVLEEAKHYLSNKFFVNGKELAK
jgi:hypothetical protein